MAPETLTAIVAALSSTLVALVLAIIGFVERRGHKREDTLLRALEHLTGGSQKRSVGIALIEGLWHRGHPFYRAVFPALINQAIYLLLETESGIGRHQFHNWLRIMDLILRVPSEPQLHAYFYELEEALQERATELEVRARGLSLDRATARLWLEKVQSHVRLI